jgi:hypothetical protein
MHRPISKAAGEIIQGRAQIRELESETRFQQACRHGALAAQQQQ